MNRDIGTGDGGTVLSRFQGWNGPRDSVAELLAAAGAKRAIGCKGRGPHAGDGSTSDHTPVGAIPVPRPQSAWQGPGGTLVGRTPRTTTGQFATSGPFTPAMVGWKYCSAAADAALPGSRPWAIHPVVGGEARLGLDPRAGQQARVPPKVTVRSPSGRRRTG
jgi:hypothetical protein